MHKHHHKRVQMGFETLVHMIYKGLGGICQAKGHQCEFVMTMFGSKYGFEDNFRVNLKLMVSKPQINLGEDFCFLQFDQINSST